MNRLLTIAGRAWRTMQDIAKRVQREALELVYKRRRAVHRLFKRDDGSLSPDGEVVLTWLARHANALTPTTAKADGAVDEAAMLINEGKRQMFLMLVRELAMDLPDVVTLLARQAKDEDIFRV